MIRRALVALAALAVSGCPEGAPAKPDPVASTTLSTSAAAPSVSSSGAVAASEAMGDPAHGKELVGKMECNRCHQGTGLEQAVFEKHCVQCHQDILSGKFAKANAATLERWQKNLVTLREVPSLTAIGKRYKRSWIEKFLVEPHDLRPRLPASMPRLPISPKDAKDIAAWLVTKDGDTKPASSPADAAGGDLAKGRELLEAKGCAACHDFSGVPKLAGGGAPPKLGERELRTAVALAPDLRFSRDRFDAPELIAWLLDPRAVKPDTQMPQTPMTPAEARDMATYLLKVELAPLAAKEIPKRLPVLERKVKWDEVNDRVFKNTCRHCHADPDLFVGDGGPGNTGGFGFPPRGLDLGKYSGVLAGWINEKGERESVFKPMADGTPRLVAAMLARQAEEAGQPNPSIRGMPLGLPSFSPEDIQLVETWIAQGRPQ